MMIITNKRTNHLPQHHHGRSNNNNNNSISRTTRTKTIKLILLIIFVIFIFFQFYLIVHTSREFTKYEREINNNNNDEEANGSGGRIISNPVKNVNEWKINKAQQQQDNRQQTSLSNTTTDSTTIYHADTNIPIFYNLYINPDNQDDIPRVKDLVKEQFQQIQPSIHWPVYVQSIGQLSKDIIDSIPNSILLGHHSTGSEILSLHSLWEYCQNNTDKSVIYLHSKGSYHPRTENDLLRRFMTYGATSTQCTNLLESECDTCSSRFTPYPHPHTSGNMWLARCSYVSKLIDPTLFTDQMDTVPIANQQQNSNNKGKVKEYMIGIGRFAAEHWIYSHPNGRPCDLYTGTFSVGYFDIPNILNENEFQLSHAPRFQSLSSYRYLESMKPWTGLQHRWKEYQVLYNETPTESWWGWRLNEWNDERSELLNQNTKIK